MKLTFIMMIISYYVLGKSISDNKCKYYINMYVVGFFMGMSITAFTYMIFVAIPCKCTYRCDYNCPNVDREINRNPRR